MAHKIALALAAIAASSPLSAQPDAGPVRESGPAPAVAAPAGGPDTRYCLRVEVTGNVVDPIECWTRAEWAEQGIDVDRHWAKEGVRVIGA